MDPHTYAVICLHFGRANDITPARKWRDHFTESELQLRQDMVLNKVAWVGSYSEDLWFFLANNHPVLAIFFSHPLHPISRWSRLTIYFLSFFWVVFISMAVSQGSGCNECNACIDCHFVGCFQLNASCPDVWEHDRDVQRLDIPIHTPEFQTFMGNFCCSVNYSGALEFRRQFGSIWGSILYCMCANTVLSFVSFQLIFCGCAQMRSRRGRRCGECVGRILFAVLSFLCIATATRNWWGYNWTHGRLPAAIHTFVSVKLISWTGATLLQVFLFTCFWHLQRPKPAGSYLECLDHDLDSDQDQRNCFARSLNPRFHVLAAEYLKVVGQRPFHPQEDVVR